MSYTEVVQDYISIKAAAKELRVSESTVRRMFDRGLLTGETTPCGHRRIHASSVQAYLQTKRGVVFDHTRSVP